MHHESWGFLHTLPASSSIPVLLIVSLFLVQSDSLSTWVRPHPSTAYTVCKGGFFELMVTRQK